MQWGKNTACISTKVLLSSEAKPSLLHGNTSQSKVANALHLKSIR